MIKLTTKQQNQAIEEILSGECYFQGVATLRTSPVVTPTLKKVRKLNALGHPNLKVRMNEQGKGNIYNLKSQAKRLKKLPKNWGKIMVDGKLIDF